jgi:hypothetical protein
VSSFNRSFFEQGWDLVPDLNNVDIDADTTPDYVDISGYDRAYWCMIKAAGTAGGDIAFAPLQATAAAGTSSKALTFTRWWHKIGTLTSKGTWTLVTEATATSDLDTGTPTDYASDNVGAAFVIEILATSLDVANGFKYVGMDIADGDFAAACIATSFWLLGGGFYSGAIPLNPLD